jgi:hypothetical protein
MQKCPYWAMQIPVNAQICPYCRMPPSLKKTEELTERMLWIVLPIIGVGFLLVLILSSIPR